MLSDRYDEAAISERTCQGWFQRFKNAGKKENWVWRVDDFARWRFVPNPRRVCGIIACDLASHFQAPQSTIRVEAEGHWAAFVWLRTAALKATAEGISASASQMQKVMGFAAKTAWNYYRHTISNALDAFEMGTEGKAVTVWGKARKSDFAAQRCQWKRTCRPWNGKLYSTRHTLLTSFHLITSFFDPDLAHRHFCSYHDWWIASKDDESFRRGIRLLPDRWGKVVKGVHVRFWDMFFVFHFQLDILISLFVSRD